LHALSGIDCKQTSVPIQLHYAFNLVHKKTFFTERLHYLHTKPNYNLNFINNKCVQSTLLQQYTAGSTMTGKFDDKPTHGQVMD